MVLSSRLKAFLGLALASLPLTAFAQEAKTPKLPAPDDLKVISTQLHNGWTVNPAGTVHQRTGDMLLGCAMNPDGKTLAMSNSGYNDHGLYLVDTATGKIRQEFPLESEWCGLIWSPDGNTLYVSGGASAQIYVYTRNTNGELAASAPLPIPDLVAYAKRTKEEEATSFIAGLAVSADGKTLYMANHSTDTVYALSLPDGKIVAKHKLIADTRPYCVRVAPDGNIYVTQWSNGVVTVLTPKLNLLRTLSPGRHPNDLLFAPDGRLFVTCANDNMVAVIDAATGILQERISTTLAPHSPAGSTPDALALAPDGKTLFVANADNNDIAVIDISQPGRSKVQGFIPTGWYPTSVAVSQDGKTLFVGSGKGMGTAPNAPATGLKIGDPRIAGVKKEGTYIATMLHGIISTIPMPDTAKLAEYTRQVMENTPYRDALLEKPTNAPGKGNSPIPSKVGDTSPIKHILYIIKENRTYDQVLGDLTDVSGKPRGNGDPGLTLFGEKVTPNQHAIAREFVTLDNLYCNGEVSGNGHPWSTGAYATDITERGWTLSYGSHNKYVIPDTALMPPVGRIWDVCEKAGLPWVSYYYTWTTDNTRRNMPTVWANALDRDARDSELADVFISELHRHEQNNDLPAFMMMSLREDHTSGTQVGGLTPQAEVASNDVGVGKIVEAFSKSKYWASTAIFVIEDDAQDGPDHVDAHRTEGYVISPYTRTGKVDSTPYRTVNMLRTMELILGLQPMSQYDAAAQPMYNAFAAKPDMTPFTLRTPGIDLNERNKATAFGAKESAGFDFSDVDKLTFADADRLNRILWHSIKGANTPYPGVTHSTFMTSTDRVPAQPTKAKSADTDNDGK